MTQAGKILQRKIAAGNAQVQCILLFVAFVVAGESCGARGTVDVEPPPMLLCFY